MSKELKLGHTMKDWTSGFIGLSICQVEHYSGLIRYGLQPQSKEADKIADALEVDAHTLEWVDDGRVADVLAPTGKPDFVLGNQVEDIVSGFFGIAMIRVTHLNGCVYYTVIGKHDSKAVIKENRQSIEEGRLRYFGPGIVGKMDKGTPHPDTNKVPGGPSTRMERR
jgi:hypothetical protein